LQAIRTVQVTADDLSQGRCVVGRRYLWIDLAGRRVIIQIINPRLHVLKGLRKGFGFQVWINIRQVPMGQRGTSLFF
jgi:hypothetical protein